MAKKQTGQIAFRYRGADSSAGVTRQTAKRMAKALGVDETQVIHFALHEMALRMLPQYEPDDGALTEAQLKQVQKAAGPVSRGPVRSSIIDPDSK